MSKGRSKREDARQFSVSFPESLLADIDAICSATYMTRTSWLVTAAREKLARDRLEKIQKIKETLE